jgi:predicted TIM-barrel fold metal-dependent hydrolase
MAPAKNRALKREFPGNLLRPALQRFRHDPLNRAISECYAAVEAINLPLCIRVGRDVCPSVIGVRVIDRLRRLLVVPPNGWDILVLIAG